MSALRSDDLHSSAGENLASPNSQSPGQTYFWPFNGDLIVDENLELSNANFKQIIYDFFKDRNLTPLSQLTATTLFPTPRVLAQFASKTYTDYKIEETDAQYETRLALPDGWKLLTTASNSKAANKYFGAAYWHPENQQVVIGHRGIKFTNPRSLLTGYSVLLYKTRSPQMGSAITFAYQVVEVLQDVSQNKGVNFQLFFTGHSLGGWLAQITTFTTEYLSTNHHIFFINKNRQDCCHPHTVVFESPGCKEILLQVTNENDVRLFGQSIDIERLDITNYLSAPNGFNTCYTHLGTVYRIFPDLSDMGWWGKHTVFYNLAMHRLDKIVEAFDPETGQVFKDDQGQLKVRVVDIWPIGLTQYSWFFEWADHSNNYHPGIINDFLSYRTNPYDERVNSLRVFSEEERKFLTRYSWLRQWPGLFKPKHLFSVMEDKPAQEETENKLQSFEIENDEILCADASALQALIPYVKRLLQLFPEIKERTKTAFSSDETGKRGFQTETRDRINEISQSPLDFKSDALNLRDFLRSDQIQVLQLQMVDADEWTGLIKVYQVLQKNGCLNEDQYTILKLKRLLAVNQSMGLSKMIQSTATSHLLLIACEDNQLLDEEAKDIIRTLFYAIKQKPNIQVILSTSSDVRTLRSLQQIGREIFGEGFDARDEKLTWGDIATVSQEKLLEKSVIFQGAKISLNEIMSAESAAANCLPLGDILEERDIKIADPVPICNAQNGGYYIGITFRRKTAIKQDIVWDRCCKKIPDFLVRTEGEFRQVSENNPKDNVHWLEKDKSGKLLWQKSQGSLATLRRYIDTDSSHTYTPVNLDKLLEQAQHQRVMLISVTAGTSKSTVLTHLSKQIKQKFPAKWVLRIDLNDHTDALEALKEEQIDKEKAIEFVSEKILKLKLVLELEMFKKSCEQKEKLKIIIMVDGFDETSPSYKETVIKLLQAVKQTAVEQLWVTTQPHLKEELEDQLQQLCYTIEPFSE